MQPKHIDGWWNPKSINPKFEELGHRVPYGDIQCVTSLIKSLSKRVGQVNVIEIGSFVGHTTIAMSELEEVGNILCIDTWSGSINEDDPINEDYKSNDVFDVFMKNVIEINTKVQCLKESSINAIIKILRYGFHIQPPNFIYIDASHEYADVLHDCMAWKKIALNFCRSNAFVIAGHDYSNKYKGVKSAVKEAFGKEMVDYYFMGNVWWTMFQSNWNQVPAIIPFCDEQYEKDIKKLEAIV